MDMVRTLATSCSCAGALHYHMKHYMKHPRHSMYAIYAYIGVVPEGSMGRHIWQSHAVPLVVSGHYETT